MFDATEQGKHNCALLDISLLQEWPPQAISSSNKLLCLFKALGVRKELNSQ
jgi:hypothetical protein